MDAELTGGNIGSDAVWMVGADAVVIDDGEVTDSCVQWVGEKYTFKRYGKKKEKMDVRVA